MRKVTETTLLFLSADKEAIWLLLLTIRQHKATRKPLLLYPKVTIRIEKTKKG